MSTAVLDSKLDARYQQLQATVRRYRRALLAFSGGVDSTLLLRVMVETLGRDNVLACLGIGDALSASEEKQARELAEAIGANIQVVNPNEMANPGYRANAPNRCYFCKSELYRTLTDVARQGNYEVIFNGTNADDLGDHRPGLTAAAEYEIVSPLADAGLTKQDVRTLSKHLQLPTWDKPAQPCLASRVIYGISVNPDRLKQIEQAEAFLRGKGLRDLRVRHHDRTARIEVPADEIVRLATEPLRSEIVTYLKQLGFTYVSLDLQGFRSGSGNEAL